MTPRIGINGLGRIGRGFLRLSLGLEDVRVVAINDVAEPAMLAHLVRHDSLFGDLDREVRAEGETLVSDGHAIRCFRKALPSEIPWREAGAETVLEATGLFTGRIAAAGHFGGGARRVIISAPSPDADLTVCYGVNHESFDPEVHRVVSNASCTTNGMAAVLAVAEEAFGIDRATMTTVHCLTNGQTLMDAPHRDPRRARAATLSMIPTTTSAAEAIARVLPSLRGRVHALAVRVPTAAVSLLDFTLALRRPVTIEQVRAAFRGAAEGRLRGVLGWSEEDLVSIDYLGDTRSAVIDAPLLSVGGGTLLKVYAWYDNERGYVQRLLDLVRHIARREGAPGGPDHVAAQVVGP